MDKLTLSYSLEMDNWAYFHDYWPQRYLRSRNESFCVFSDAVRAMNTGSPGVFESGTKPYIIDVVFNFNKDVFVDGVLWDTVVAGFPDDTFTHITISTETETTGRRVLTTPRRIQGVYSFNEIRSIVNSLPFKDDVFNDYNILAGTTTANKPWYEKPRIIDNHAIVRFEYTGINLITFIGAITDSQISSR